MSFTKAIKTRYQSLRSWRHRYRVERAKRWQSPLVTFRDQLAAYASMLISDHGFWRYIRPNLDEIAPGLWRSAQPTPTQLRRWHRAHGLKTVVNLRNPGEYGSWALETQTCRELGIHFVNYRMRSRALPTAEEVLAFPQFLASLERPLLVHCKSGSDRAGLFCALHVLMIDRGTASQAAEQLSWRYGHHRHANTGVLDMLIVRFAEDGEKLGMTFEEWVRTKYDPTAIEAAYRPRYLSSLLGDRIMKRE